MPDVLAAVLRGRRRRILGRGARDRLARRRLTRCHRLTRDRRRTHLRRVHRGSSTRSPRRGTRGSTSRRGSRRPRRRCTHRSCRRSPRRGTGCWRGCWGHLLATRGHHGRCTLPKSGTLWEQRTPGVQGSPRVRHGRRVRCVRVPLAPFAPRRTHRSPIPHELRTLHLTQNPGHDTPNALSCRLTPLLLCLLCRCLNTPNRRIGLRACSDLSKWIGWCLVCTRHHLAHPHCGETAHCLLPTTTKNDGRRLSTQSLLVHVIALRGGDGLFS